MSGSLVSPTILTSTMASSAAWQEVLTEMLITNNFLPVGFPSRHTHFSYFAEFEVFIIISKFHVISFAKLGPGGSAGPDCRTDPPTAPLCSMPARGGRGRREGAEILDFDS